MKLINKKKQISKLFSKQFYFSILAIAVFLVACEPDDGTENPTAIRDKYLGTWQVTENTGINHPQFYTISIVEGDVDDELLLQGLYNTTNTRVVALINGTELSIPNQTSADIVFVGSGSANADYSQIALSFSADDGSGPDNVEAVLVK